MCPGMMHQATETVFGHSRPVSDDPVRKVAEMDPLMTWFVSHYVAKGGGRVAKGEGRVAKGGGGGARRHR